MNDPRAPNMSRQQRRKAEREAASSAAHAASAAVAAERWTPLRLSDERDARRSPDARLYKNHLYRVWVAVAGSHDGYAAEHVRGWLHVMIRRHDNQPVVSWHHKQRIKEEIAGADCEGVELFPSRSRVIDVGNVYHLWVNPDPRYRFDLGFDNPRKVDPERDYPAPSAPLHRLAGHE